MLAFFRVISILFLLGLLAAGAGFYGVTEYLRRPAPLAQETIVDVKRGMSGRAIAGKLAEKGVIAYPDLFYILSRFSGKAAAFKAGEYRFTPGETPQNIMKKLRDGDVIRRFITLPEGRTSFEAVMLLQEAPFLTGDIEDIPAEGTLLPETYSYVKGETRKAVLERMKSAMSAALDDIWRRRAENAAVKNKKEAVILASVIEKETGLDGERALVGGVFANRLRKGMKLQSDPTVIYAVTKGMTALDRPISKKDLRNPDPYNTYFAAGLPPGPICNPGKDALRAALNPAETDALYFVADGKGGHAFTENLRDHNKEVRKLRLREKAAREKAAQTSP